MQGCFSQEMLKDAVENMQDSFAYFSAIKNKDGKIIDFKVEYINRAGYNNSSIEKAECLGKKLSEIHCLNTRIGLIEDYCRVVETGAGVVKESLIYDDGHLKEAYEVCASKCGEGLTLVWRETTSRMFKELALAEAKNVNIKIEALLEDQKVALNTLKSVVDIIPAGVLVTDSRGRFILTNAMAASLMGGTITGDAYGPKGSFTLHKIDGTPYPKNELPIVRTLKYGIEVVNDEVLLRTEEGKETILLASCRPIYNEFKNFSGVAAVLKDITDRKIGEEKLRESEETIRALLNSITEAIVLCDLEGKVETINETAAKRYGKKPEDMVGKCIFNFMPEDLAKVRRRNVSNNISLGIPVRFSDMRNGMYLENFLYPVFNGKGEAVKFAAFTQDITERKLAEQAQRRLAAIVESTDEAIIGKTGEGIIISWNKAAEEMYGYTAEEMIGKSIFTLVPEHEVAEMEEILKKIQNGERISHKETVRKRKNGSLLYVSVTISPIFDSDGKVLGASSIAHDITERKKGEQEIALKNEELKVQRAEAVEANRLKSQFLANMSHELRTPLNSIIGFTTRVIKKCGDILPPVQLDNLNIVKEEAQHLLDLINSLLDYSKVEAGKMEVHREAFNLVKVIDEVNSMVKMLMDGKTLNYEYELCSNENLFIISDRIKLKQILINLLSNAIKYSEKGTIKFSISEENDYYCMKVKDEGIGIADENLENIFDEFRQIDGSYTRKVGGTGLGLSITKKFVEMLEGKIEVKSKLGEGSCFTVYIPIEISKPKVDSEGKENYIETKLNNKIKVACIDDDNNVQRLYKQYLTEQGYEVIPLYGYEDVTAKIQEIMPDVILLDIMLPNKDGWQVLGEIKSTPKTRSIPVIMASVLSEKNLAFRMKADEYLIKPVSQDELLDTIIRTISKKDGLEILLADDDENFLNLMGQFLSEEAVSLRFANNGEEAVEEINKKKPDIAILDLMMPKKDGFSVVDYIRNNEKLQDIPVIIMTSKDLSESEKDELLLRTNMVVQKSGTNIEKVMQMIIKKIKERSEYCEDSCNA